MKKTLVAIGDSITLGTYTAETDKSADSIVEHPFAEQVANHFGYNEFINCGMNGTSVSRTADVFSDQAMSIRIDQTPNADLLIVAAGTNDYAGSLKIGTYDDGEDFSFSGGVSVFFSKIAKRYKKVAVITPIPRECDGENESGHTLDDYRRVLAHFAELHGFILIDGSKVNIDAKSPEGRALYMRDGLHPNQEGHDLYAEYLISELEKVL